MFLSFHKYVKQIKDNQAIDEKMFSGLTFIINLDTDNERKTSFWMVLPYLYPLTYIFATSF